MKNKIEHTEPFRENTITVLLTGTSYPCNDQDWRGRFLADMLEALSCCRTLEILTWLPPGKIPSNVVDAGLPNESRFLRTLLEAGGIAHILRSRNIRGIFWVLKLLKNLRAVYQRESRADVIHINWLQNAIPLWGSHTPALITILGTDYKLLSFPGMVPMLRRVIKQRKTIIAPNASWMGSELEKQFGDIAQIQPIPFGVQQRWFNVKREYAGQNPKEWLIVTRLTAKKIGPLFEWGKEVFDENNLLCLLGPNQENLPIPEWVQYKGATYPKELEEKWFPSVAGLITLSRHDEGRPQVILEAMAAGIPVIASDLPAHRDIVIHGKTGMIVKTSEDFRRAIHYMSIPENNRRMGVEAKKWIKERIGTWKDCAMRYKNAYMALTGRTI